MTLTKNKFGVLFSLTIFTCLWGIYLFLIKSKDPNEKYLFGECLLDYKYHMPLINRNNELDYEKCFDGWSLVHLGGYIITGILFPNEFLFVLLLSILCEIGEIIIKSRGRLSDVIINSIGYMVGTLLSSYIKIDIDIDDEYNNFIIPCIILVIFVFYKISKKRKNDLDKLEIPTWKE
jgi:hypothetical protein